MDTYQWTSMESTGGVMNRLRSGRNPDSDDWSLHTAGPDNPDSATRLRLRGTAAIGSGPGWSRRSGAGQSGMDGLTAETAVSRAGRAWTKMWPYRKVPFSERFRRSETRASRAFSSSECSRGGPGCSFVTPAGGVLVCTVDMRPGRAGRAKPPGGMAEVGTGTGLVCTCKGTDRREHSGPS